ncbi:pilus assembly protein [Endozoicomonas sp. ALD040]|uniref:pilus assembly protein n=1 Tax=Endozoicomonas sp. ALD040 TaxID=3403079 RepID=UPI003BAFED56
MILFKTKKYIYSVVRKLSILSPLLLSFTAGADDTDIFIGGNINNNERPQVLVIFDNSGSMNESAGSLTLQYDNNVTYRRLSSYPYRDRLYDVKLRHKIVPIDSSEQNCETLENNQFRCNGNYLNWFSRRLDLAKDAIQTLISDNTKDIDFGLSIFNSSKSPIGHYGGYIFNGVRQRNANETQSLINLVGNIQAETWTPLCDTFYEVYRYLTEGSIYFGQNSSKGDTSVESNGDYISPVRSCQNLYVIYMTDGEPSQDGSRNNAIKNLRINGTDRIATCDKYKDYLDEMSENCLPKLAKYLANPGESGLDGNSSTGSQKAYTYTIGFATDQSLLYDTAREGNGVCYTTVGSNTDSESGCIAVDDIASAFQGAIKEILKRSSTFVSPAVAVNSFNRTETLDNAYYSMFLPSESSRWTGNIKKLKVFKSQTETPECGNGDDYDVGTVVDRGCDQALKEGSSQIDDGASTYWGTINDGDQVESGGLGEQLLTSRGSFYTNIVTSDGSEQISSLDNIPASSFNIASGKTYSAQNLISWLKGGSDASGSNRGWVLGDILHSRPVTLNYGARTNAYTQTNPDIRIVFGTNFGQLHFIEDQGNTVRENWSFFAKESAPIVPSIYENLDDVPHPYGLDGQISLLRLDVNNDGSIKKADKDRMILFFGMRRGGTSYYAIDVTDPEAPPILLWRIDNSTPGFEEMGQSWAPPVPVILPGHRFVEETVSGSSTTKTVYYKYALAFGAGYDGDGINGKDDDRTGEEITDLNGETRYERYYSTRGRGIYFVDAATGSLIKSFTAPDTDDTNDNDATRFEYSDLKWSVPSPPAVLDSNGDGLVDRVYVPDSGGNVFRIDIGKDYNDEGDELAIWSIFKFAELGADAPSNKPSPDSTDDKRFMYQPEIVRTVHRGEAYDAVVLGTGNRANPLTETNLDHYYVLRDKNLFYRYYKSGDCNGCTTPPATIRHSDLYNATANTIQTGTAIEQQEALSQLAGSYGWYIQLESTGEKTTTTGQVYGGQLLFSTYSPSSNPGANICTPGVGSSYFYVLNLHTASAIRQEDDSWVRKTALSVIGTPGDATIFSPGAGKNLVDLNTGYNGIPSEIGLYRYGWVEQQ